MNLFHPSNKFPTTIKNFIIYSNNFRSYSSKYGHFYVGKYWLSLIKISLIIISLSSSFYLYSNFKFPELFDSLFEKIAFGGILGFRKKEEEGDGDGDDGEEKNDEEQGNTKLRG